MDRPARVALLVGSLRQDSFNRRLAHVLAGLAPQNMTFDEVPFRDLPLYDQDLETDAPPAPWQQFRDRVRPADALLFVTPEYNRSVPGGLKNALDVGSRPAGRSVWRGKPGAVVSGSTGGIGGFGANHALRQSLVYLDVPTLPQPEAYIGNIGNIIGADGTLTRDDTRTFLTKFMAAFGAFIDRNRA